MVKETAELIAGFGVHWLLIALPGVAAVLLVMRRGLKSVPLLIAVGLLASGTVSYLAFWAYYGSEAIGATWDFLILGGSLLAVCFCWREGGLDGEVLRKLATPLWLWFFGSAFIVFFGFLHGGAHNPIPMAAYRFSGELPSDNDIPRYFIEWFATHGHQHPPEYPGEWLFSDRPPLQVGYGLAQRGFFNTASGLHYQLIAVIENCLWIPAMWAVLVAVPLRKLTRSIAMLAAMVSDIAIVHGFFVWPKLIAAAFLLAALAVILSPDWRRDRRDLRVAGLIGALLALSMLCHGSSIFGVVPLVIFAAFRGVPNWRWLAVALAGLLLFYVPWSAYQKYADPPGNRLLKWQLGGETEVNSEGTLEAIENGYKRVGLSGAIDLKEENFEEMVGWPRTKNEWNSAIAALEQGRPGEAVAKVRWDRFFSLFPFLGILLLGPIAMLIAWLTKKKRDPEGWRDPDEWRFSLLCFAFFVLACVTWGLLLFGTPEARTTIHVGSLAVPLLGAVGCVVAMRSVYPRAGIVLAVVNVVFVLLLYAPSFEPPEPGTSYSVLNGLLTIGALGGITWVLFRGPVLPDRLLPGRFRSSGGGEVPAPAESKGGRVGELRQTVGTRLFPMPISRATRFSPGEGAVVIAAFLVLATALSILRLGTDGYQTIWAEDSRVFMESAFTHGYWQALSEPYAGYLVIMPRLIGGLGAVLPLQDAAAVIAIVSAFVAALSGLAVWFGSGGHLRDPWLRGGLTIATVLAATSGQEVLDSAAYVPWFMLVGSFWLLFSRPKTWWGALLAAAFILLTGLSTPGVWFFLPVAALRIFSLSLPRDRREALVVGAWALGGLIQIPVILGQEQGTSLWSWHIFTALLQRVIDGGIFGQWLGVRLWEVFGWGFLAALCIVLVIVLPLGLRRSPASARWFVSLAIPISCVMFIFSVYQRSVGLVIFWSSGSAVGTASRYVLVPASLFLGALVVTLDGTIRNRGGRRLRSSWPAIVGVAVMLVAVGFSFDQVSSERSKPYWGEALRSAADKCITKHEELAGIAASPAPFGLVVSCNQVKQFASASVRRDAS